MKQCEIFYSNNHGYYKIIGNNQRRYGYLTKCKCCKTDVFNYNDTIYPTIYCNSKCKYTYILQKYGCVYISHNNQSFVYTSLCGHVTTQKRFVEKRIMIKCKSCKKKDTNWSFPRPYSYYNDRFKSVIPEHRMVSININDKVCVVKCKTCLYPREIQFQSVLDNNECMSCASKSDHTYRDQFDIYKLTVKSLTEKTYRRYKNIINPYGFCRGITSHHLDHKFSVLEGFKNGILPVVISNKHNLCMLSYKDNINKSDRCSISKKYLYDGIR